jgi:hypothetical protein
MVRGTAAQVCVARHGQMDDAGELRQNNATESSGTEEETRKKEAIPPINVDVPRFSDEPLSTRSRIRASAARVGRSP